MSNLNLNKVILAGRLTGDPELKVTTSGVNVCEFSLAINRKVIGQQPRETDFIKCQAWRQTAEFISRYFKKGSALCVVGSIQTRSWTDNNGQKRFVTEAVIDEAMLVDSANEGANSPQSSQTTRVSKGEGLPSQINMRDIRAGIDEDLPF